MSSKEDMNDMRWWMRKDLMRVLPFHEPMLESGEVAGSV